MRYVVSLLVLLASVGAAHAEASTYINFGPILNDTIGWLATAFGAILATLVTATVYKTLGFIGVQTTLGQREQLQSIIVNGLNSAASKAQAAVIANPNLNIDVKSEIVSDAITYAQKHGSETLKALGFDPDSGEAVEVIKARIATAIADPATPTPSVLAQPLAPVTPSPLK